VQIFSTLSQIVHLAESRGARDIATLAIELERELTRIIAKLVDLKMLLDDILEIELGTREELASLTKIENDVIDVLRESSTRCVTMEELLRRLSSYAHATTIMAVKRLKKLKLVDLDVDVDSGGKPVVKICLRTASRV